MSNSHILFSDELDEMYSALSNRHNRAVCLYFRTTSTEVSSVDELVDFILERDERSEERIRVEVRLRIATLPNLEEAGFIDYDERSETVRYRGHETLESWLDCIAEEQA